MALADDLERIAQAAQARGAVTGVLAADLLDGTHVYLCAYESGAWLALGDDMAPLTSRQAVRDAAALTGLCEIAHGRERIVDVQQQISERERIELAVGERERLRAPLASSIATAAVPVATSSTRPAVRGTRETRKRRHRGSCPKESSRA